MTPEEVAEVEARLEEGWAGTILVEPLTALAGGILGGALAVAVAWRYAWPRKPRRAAYRVRRV